MCTWNDEDGDGEALDILRNADGPEQGKVDEDKDELPCIWKASEFWTYVDS